ETVAVTPAPQVEPQSPQPAVHREPPVDVFVVSDEAINELLSQSDEEEAPAAATEPDTGGNTAVAEADSAVISPDGVPALQTASPNHASGLDPAAMDADPSTHVRLAAGVPSLTDEELAAVGELPPVPVARSVSPESGGRREGARSLGFFAR
ncbi:MAG: hypothetical protein QOH99_819, partial [Frankiaceae bacterium]|nr:hypothetical protein [Frankiaceae bacterium]